MKRVNPDGGRLNEQEFPKYSACLHQLLEEKNAARVASGECQKVVTQKPGPNPATGQMGTLTTTSYICKNQ